jgi:tryptophan-rich sensory protein
MSLTSVLVLCGFLAVCFAAASTGAFFRPGLWYEQLDKPAWRPPNWLFAPAWSVFYVTIAVAGWLVWRRAGFAGAAFPLAVYAVHLLINMSWSALFFGLRRPDLAFADIILLWLSIVATITVFHGVVHFAAWLLLPYLGWVSFASVLNFSIWRRNRLLRLRAIHTT